MHIYDVIVLQHPTKAEADNGQEVKILWEERVQAPNEFVACMLVGAAIDIDLSEIPAGRLEVRLRPFAASR